MIAIAVVAIYRVARASLALQHKSLQRSFLAPQAGRRAVNWSLEDFPELCLLSGYSCVLDAAGSAKAELALVSYMPLARVCIIGPSRASRAYGAVAVS